MTLNLSWKIRQKRAVRFYSLRRFPKLPKWPSVISAMQCGLQLKEKSQHGDIEYRVLGVAPRERDECDF